jgi:hypothetical protein
MPGEIAINPKVLSDDGIWYSIKALSFGGDQRQEAADQTIQWWNQFRALYDPEYKKLDLIYDLKLTDKFFGHRLVYPAASAWFVSVFGFLGLLIVPILAFSGIWIILTSMLKKVNIISFFVPLFLLVASTHYTQNAISTAGTDVLLTFLIMLFIFSVIKLRKRKTILFFILHIIILIGNFTRPSFVFWVLLSVCLIPIVKFNLQDRKVLKYLFYISFFINNIICYVFIENTWQSFSVVRNFDYYPENYRIDTFLLRFVSGVYSDGITLLAKDFTLLLLFILATFYFSTHIKELVRIIRRRKLQTLEFDEDTVVILFTIAVIASVYVSIIFTGITGIRLRYHMPIFPLLTILAAKQLEYIQKSKLNSSL